jgi:hypothetical protein
MLTTRNVFIANLAVSDMFLCAFTMPLTLVDLVTKYWSLGPNQVTILNFIHHAPHPHEPGHQILEPGTQSGEHTELHSPCPSPS